MRTEDAHSSYLILRPGAPSRVLAPGPSSDALCS